MFRTPRQLVAALLLISAVGGCTSAAATAAPSSNPVVTTSAAGGTPSPTSATPSPTSATPTAETPSPAAPNAATAGGALGGPVAKGGNFCDLLGPGDFAGVGVSGAHTPTKNSDGTADAYCVYSGISGSDRRHRVRHLHRRSHCQLPADRFERRTHRGHHGRSARRRRRWDGHERSRQHGRHRGPEGQDGVRHRRPDGSERARPTHRPGQVSPAAQ